MPKSPAVEEALPAAAPEEKPRVEPGRFANWPISLAILVASIIVDQLSKLLAVAALLPPNGHTRVLIPGVFHLRYAENTGAAFSFFTGQVGWLAIVSVLASVFMGWWWYRLPATERWGRLSLVIVIGGAIGNLIDRARLGYVVDFFDVYIFGYDYPVFNIADSLICIGVAVLLWRAWKGKV